MNYTKSNLHGGLMNRVGRQNDKLYENQLIDYNKKVQDSLFTPEPMRRGKGLNKSNSIEPKADFSLRLNVAPKRISTRLERSKRRY